MLMGKNTDVFFSSSFLIRCYWIRWNSKHSNTERSEKKTKSTKEMKKFQNTEIEYYLPNAKAKEISFTLPSKEESWNHYFEHFQNVKELRRRRRNKNKTRIIREFSEIYRIC